MLRIPALSGLQVCVFGVAHRRAFWACRYSAYMFVRKVCIRASWRKHAN
jgi:hypothetical protein